MHIVKRTDFLNETVYHDEYDMRTVKSVAIKVNTNLYDATEDKITLHISGVRMYTRKQVYKSGQIEMVKRVIALDDENHFQQDVFPYAKTEDDIASDNVTKSCCAAANFFNF